MNFIRSDVSGRAPSVEVVIEIPRGSFLKRGSNGVIDFISPLPCPFNYGSVCQYIGGEGDFLDAVVLGPRLSAGSRVTVTAFGAVGLSERYMYDDKLICANTTLKTSTKREVLWFFHTYAFCKAILNLVRGRRGWAHCNGWGDASAAIARAVPVAQLPQRPKKRSQASIV